MTEFNSYPVFVADQVLMADHLNEIVNYLDEQDRLTRNKLIGIGIVCGLELKVSTNQIQITKGCGVTSAGYLIVQDALTLSYYHPYTLPSDFFPKYRETYKDWNMWELLTAEQSLQFEDIKPVETNKAFMRDKLVVLLLEMKEKPLKNCVDTDCDDKGEKIEFKIRPLLVQREGMEELIGGTRGTRSIAHNLAEEPRLRDVQLRRFNVPVEQLTSTDVVLNAFLKILDETTLKNLAEVLNYCYVNYQPILFEEPVNPFSNVFEQFKNYLSVIKNANPFFIQYYYDWIDDILKTYYEFKSKVSDVQVMCCPDEDLFPLHLMLGQATKSTSIDIKSKYRHYFLYSPLSNQQKDLLAEVQLLFRKMKLLIQNFVIPNPTTFPNTAVKITPSKYLDRPISDRCIPYYYSVEGLYQAWNWSKTRKGNANCNLSYNANQYSTLDAIVNPLLYDIERFNFFRVEGHVGKNYTQALTSVITQRDQFNLPFDVVALSTATVARFVASADKECMFKDLESLYQVIIAELICKFGDVACMIADVPYFNQFNIAGPVIHDTPLHDLSHSEVGSISGSNFTFSTKVLEGMTGMVSSIRAALFTGYKRGDFLRNHCTMKKGTIGEIYLMLVDKGYAFEKPAPTENPNIYTVYSHLFYFLDCVENTMGASWPYVLSTFTIAPFKTAFNVLTEESAFISTNRDGIMEIAREYQLPLEEILGRFPGLVHTCFDERLEALKNEYLKRYKEVQVLINFMNYFKAHPGMEHKAGVPKGGTFILVYHETPPTRPIRQTQGIRDVASIIRGMSSSIRETANVKARTAAATVGSLKAKSEMLSEPTISELLKEAAVKDPALLKNFEVALSRYLNVCKDMDDDTRNEITDILIGIPQILVPTTFRIPEHAVVADFYLPYICCSDCAPITYVVPRAPEAILSIGITPTEFCNNDEGSYPVAVSPEGGALSASGGGVEQGSFVFKPKGLKSGKNTLTYTLPDGRAASVDVMITEPAKIDFKFEVQNDGITVKFFIGSDQIKQAVWEFGDGSKTEELEPIHTYQFSEEQRDFIVKLIVKDGPCISTVEHSVTLRKPEQIDFNIVPRLFSALDDRSYDFITKPVPKNTKDFKNDNKLSLSRDTSTGVISFIPSKQKAQETQDYRLEYQGIEVAIRIVVPNADFNMNLTNVPNPTHGFSTTVLELDAKNEKADNYTWILQQGDRVLNFTGKKVPVGYRNSQLSENAPLTITLVARNEIPGASCEDRKTFILTPDLLHLHMNQGVFDNNSSLI